MFSLLLQKLILIVFFVWTFFSHAQSNFFSGLLRNFEQMLRCPSRKKSKVVCSDCKLSYTVFLLLYYSVLNRVLWTSHLIDNLWHVSLPIKRSTAYLTCCLIHFQIFSSEHCICDLNSKKIALNFTVSFKLVIFYLRVCW